MERSYEVHIQAKLPKENASKVLEVYSKYRGKMRINIGNTVWTLCNCDIKEQYEHGTAIKCIFDVVVYSKENIYDENFIKDLIKRIWDSYIRPTLSLALGETPEETILIIPKRDIIEVKDGKIYHVDSIILLSIFVLTPIDARPSILKCLQMSDRNLISGVALIGLAFQYRTEIYHAINLLLAGIELIRKHNADLISKEEYKNLESIRDAISHGKHGTIEVESPITGKCKVEGEHPNKHIVCIDPQSDSELYDIACIEKFIERIADRLEKYCNETVTR